MSKPKSKRRKCQGCDKGFNAALYLISRGGGKYCSRKCGARARWANASKDKHLDTSSAKQLRTKSYTEFVTACRVAKQQGYYQEALSEASNTAYIITDVDVQNFQEFALEIRDHSGGFRVKLGGKRQDHLTFHFMDEPEKLAQPALSTSAKRKPRKSPKINWFPTGSQAGRITTKQVAAMYGVRTEDVHYAARHGRLNAIRVRESKESWFSPEEAKKYFTKPNQLELPTPEQSSLLSAQLPATIQ